MKAGVLNPALFSLETGPKMADFRAWRSLRESNPCLRRERVNAFEINHFCQLGRFSHG